MDSTLDIALNKDYQAQNSKKVVITDNQTSERPKKIITTRIDLTENIKNESIDKIGRAHV